MYSRAPWPKGRAPALLTCRAFFPFLSLLPSPSASLSIAHPTLPKLHPIHLPNMAPKSGPSLLALLAPSMGSSSSSEVGVASDASSGPDGRRDEMKDGLAVQCPSRRW